LKEFLIQNYGILTKGVIIFAAIVGLLNYKKYENSVAKYFIYFLFYVFFLEIIATYPRYLNDYDFLSLIKDKFKGSLFERNYWFYTLFWGIGSVLFFSFYYQKIIKNIVFLKIIRIMTYMFLFSSIIYILLNWEPFFRTNLNFISLFGASIILLCIIFYFIEILRSEKVLTFYKSINFYISVALLVWWLVTRPLIFYNIYFSTSDWNFILLQWEVKLLANIFMYLTFAFAFIYAKPEND